MKNFDDFPLSVPLRALKAFEATARLGTMAAAAHELSISPSAVSHQLSILEAHLQLRLLKRLGRGVQLTEIGREYFRSVRAAFTVLRDATGHLRERAAPIEVTLSTIPLFATGWLIPHLREFTEIYPDVSLNITYASHQNYLSDSADLSIRFGEGQWNGFESVKLMSGAVMPICSKDFLDTYGPFETHNDLQAVPLIHDQDRAGWSLWFESCGLNPPASRLGSAVFEDGQLAVAAAQAGLGIALLRPPLVASELEARRLVAPFDHFYDDGRHYFLCERIDSALSDAEISFRDWLTTKLSSMHKELF
jgi:LysR family glycine cleavage system transcriptional activator